ncbi:MAG TPA: HlyD family efflux transporter periplasmic adaptor subunit [Alphaproteobacteria bacterium]|nr:HlyD family efflux transporter periplasmic adaptor subunit [Alphaproteobacteria bacterium]
MSMAATTSSAEPAAHLRPAQADQAPKAPAPKKEAPRRKRRVLVPLLVTAIAIAAAAAGGWYWWQEQLRALPPGIAKANGRLEAERVEIATKYQGRIATVLAIEGQMVDAGEVVARMDTKELEAELRAAEAQVVRAQHEKTLSDAKIAQRVSERTFAQQELVRASELQSRGHGTVEMLDRRRSELKTAQAAHDAAVADLNAAVATIAARQAEVARLKAQLEDSVLVAPKRGRIQYKLAQPGEVLQSGGRVLTLIDLSDVYLTVFVPARVAGPLGIGDEARVVLDPLPGFVFPAKITFVATEAQFTPKMVETPEEREKLMFRVKLTIDPELRPKYESQVKTGLRGVGYVRSDRNIEWPQALAVKLP